MGEEPSDIEEGGLDLSVQLKPVSFYITDKKEMLHQCFCIIGEKKLQKMLPDILKVLFISLRMLIACNFDFKRFVTMLANNVNELRSLKRHHEMNLSTPKSVCLLNYIYISGKPFLTFTFISVFVVNGKDNITRNLIN